MLWLIETYRQSPVIKRQLYLYPLDSTGIMRDYYSGASLLSLLRFTYEELASLILNTLIFLQRKLNIR